MEENTIKIKGEAFYKKIESLKKSTLRTFYNPLCPMKSMTSFGVFSCRLYLEKDKNEPFIEREGAKAAVNSIGSVMTLFGSYVNEKIHEVMHPKENIPLKK